MPFTLKFEKKEAACFTYNRFRDYVKHVHKKDLTRYWPQRQGSNIIVHEEIVAEAQRFADQIKAGYSIERV